MKKMRLFVPLLVILVMGMATSAFAQLNCAVATGTISRATLTGHAEPVGDISFTCTPPAGATATGTATITVQYPVTITDTVGYPALAPIRITDNIGGFAPGPGAPTIAVVSNTTGQIVISVPGQAAPAVSAFTLRGVLVSLVGALSTSDLKATISVSPPQTAGSNVLINSGDNNPTVITSIMNGINTTNAPPALVATTSAALFLGNGTNVVPTRAGFAITTTENYIDMFRSAFNMSSNAANVSTQLLYTFSGMAAGSTIGPCTAAVSAGGVATPLITVTPVGVTTAAAGAAGTATMTVSFTGVAAGDSPNQTAIETVTLTCGTNAATIAGSVPGFSAAGVAAGALPITASIAATVTLAPTGSALSTAAATLNAPLITVGSGGNIPRYASTPISIGNVVTFTPATTTLLIPYVTVSKDAAAYNTGISIANTTADAPSFNTAATGAALDQSGTITFTFFPSDGSASSTFTTTTPTLPGGSYIQEVGNLLPLATPPINIPANGYFQGYIFAVANFTNGHGAAFVYGGTAASRITSTTDVLVLASPLIQPRNLSPAGFPQVEYTTK